jgi:predicted acyl esterase
MFGVSYFAVIQLFVAALNPPSLKCLFAPHAVTDYYRDQVYRGGILGYKFTQGVAKGYSNPRCELITRKKFGDEELKKRIANALEDEDITAVPGLAEILKNPDQGINPFIVDLLVNPLDGPYWEERKAKHDAIKIPAYIGGCWGNYGLHLPGAFRSWENLKVPKKMVIGPPVYFDRPLYQPQYESLRWFDYWLKGIDTGIMEEPPVRLFVMGTNKWKETTDWPLPETKWTPFYLHEDELLCEHEHWPNEGFDSFEDSPWQRGSLEYYSPTLVEDTEVIGPMALNLYASTTDNEVLWFISLREVDRQGNEKVLTRGWLRGTHREVDPKHSKPWAPFHPHTKSEPLTPGKIYEFNIAIIPTGNIRRQSPSRITVYHDAEHPSHLLLPITSGNVLGTFISGGKPYVNF